MIRRIRAWAERHAAEGRYSPVGIAFHWVMAALVVFQLAWGWWVGTLPVGAAKLQGYQTHSDVGLLIILLGLLRASWRLIVPAPVNDADHLGVQTTLARITHIIFYFCFFALPISGWAMWSSLGSEANSDLRLAGIVPWPHLPFDDLPLAVQWTILDWAEDVHLALVWVLLILIPLHVGAALKHHFWDRHDVLIGMLPELPEDEDREGPPRRMPEA